MSYVATEYQEIHPYYSAMSEYKWCCRVGRVYDNKTIKDGDIAPWKDLKKKIEQR